MATQAESRRLLNQIMLMLDTKSAKFKFFLHKASFSSALRIRIRGPGAFFTPGSGIRDREKNPDPESGMNIPDLIFFYAVRILDIVNPGSRMEQIGSGIRDKHPGFTTLSVNS